MSGSPAKLKALDVPVFVARGVRHLAETNLRQIRFYKQTNEEHQCPLMILTGS